MLVFHLPILGSCPMASRHGQWPDPWAGVTECCSLLAGHREITGGGEASIERGRRGGSQVRIVEPQCRPALQIRRHLAHRRVEQDRAARDAARGADGPLARRKAEISTSSLKPMGHGVVNPPLDVQKYLPASVDSENYGRYEDQKEIDLDEAMLHAADLPTQHALMHDFEKSGLGGTLARRIAPDPKAATHVKLPHSPSMP